MLFIYNSLSEGRTVRKVDEKKYEFTKNTDEKKN